jgi:serine/threonine protein kinase
MSASTDPAAWRPPVAGEQRTAREWLEALTRGACDQASFTQAVDALVQGSEDEAWEVLSLLDQYYRRGKMPADQFRSLKAHVDRLVLGSPRDANAVGAATSQAAAPPLAPASPAGPPPAARAPAPRPSSPPAGAAANFAMAATGGTGAEPAGGAARAIGGGVRRRAPAVGDVLRQRYELSAVLGKGGMGTVFEAVDRFRVENAEAANKLAIKVLHSVVLDRPELFDELRSEFQHLQSLSHPNIVRVHEFDRDGDTAFFTMELLQGVPLSALLGARKNGALPREHALALMRDIGAAVAHAHSRNVVHGDLNPQNIFVTDAGEVRVLDFGASHKLKQTPWVSDFEDAQQPPAATPAFGSCQLLEGETADVRDDVFAFACVSYMLLTGKHPFQSRTAIEARTAGLRPRRPENLSAGQWRALQAGLAFERDRRPADVEAWLRALNLRQATPRLPPLPVLMSTEARGASAPVLTTIVIGVLVILALAVWSKIRHARTVPSATPSALTAADTDTATNAAAAPADSAPADTPSTEAAPSDTARAAHAGAAKPVPSPTPAAAAVAAATSPAAGAEVRAPSASSRTPTPPAAPKSTPAAIAGPAPLAPISLASATVEVAPQDPVARVTVRRKGNLRGDVSFMWWTESGTAKPGVDFAAAKPQIAHIESGKNSTTLLVPIVSDPSKHAERSFYVVIDDAGADSGARIIGTPTTMVTIQAPE